MWEFHDCNCNGLGDIWLTDKCMYFSSIDYQCKRRLTWSPKSVDSTNQKRLPVNAHAHRVSRLACNGKIWLHFCHHGDTIYHPKSGYVTTKLYGTSTCRCNNNAIFSDRAISSFLPSTYAGHANLAAAKPWQFITNWKDGNTVEFITFSV